MSVKNKQNSSVNFLILAEYLNVRPPPARPSDRPPLVITMYPFLLYPTALMAEGQKPFGLHGLYKNISGLYWWKQMGKDRQVIEKY